MKKGKVCIKITEKNIDKVYRILKKYNQNIFLLTADRLRSSTCDSSNPNIVFNRDCWIGKSDTEGYIKVKPKELEAILILEKLENK